MPWIAVAGTAISAASSMYGSSNAPAPPTQANANTSGNVFDASGWTVNTGGGVAVGGTSGQGGGIPWLWILAGSVVGLVVLKRLKKR